MYSIFDIVHVFSRFISLFIDLFVSLFIYIYLSFYLSIYLFIYLFIYSHRYVYWLISPECSAGITRYSWEKGEQPHHITQIYTNLSSQSILFQCRFHLSSFGCCTSTGDAPGWSFEYQGHQQTQSHFVPRQPRHKLWLTLKQQFSEETDNHWSLTGIGEVSDVWGKARFPGIGGFSENDSHIWH